MDDRTHKKLIHHVEELRAVVAKASTSAVVGVCAAYWQRRHAGVELVPGLLSPAKQWQFLLGLMLTTPEPDEPHDFGPEDAKKAGDLLREIFSAYAMDYFRRPGEEVDDEWHRTREVAMPSFLDFFMQGLLASVEQVGRRIQGYLSPFDSVLKDELGINASETLDVCNWLSKDLQQHADDLVELTKKGERATQEIQVQAGLEGWSPERQEAEMRASTVESIAREWRHKLLGLNQVRLAALRERFGIELASVFWSLFAATRGELDHLQYPTEPNVAEERSLFKISDDVAICPLGNQLYHAALNRLERQLESSDVKERYYRRRDKVLEEDARLQFPALLGDGWRYYQGLYETPDRQYEHDLVIRRGETVLVVEAKASPPTEPFRDPSQAYERIRRAFRSKKGLQHAYHQGKRIWRRWKSDEPVHLFDSSGELALEFNSTTVTEVVLICLTRDNYGSIAVDLARLLEKETGEPYPWAVNIIDLEAIGDAWNHFNWGSEQFLDFVRERVKLHGHLMTSDELEVVGYFIKHGGLNRITESLEGLLDLHPDYAKVFDEIYLARTGNGPPVEYRPTEPSIYDLRESLRQDRLVPPSRTVRRKIQKQGRNAQCACGSGKKYKRCCGK